MAAHLQSVPNKCRACRRCEVACIAAHQGLTFKEALKRRSELVSRVHVVNDNGFKTTVRCHQCEEAPCAAMCPTGALQQDKNTGQIIMRVQLCSSCKLCIAVCPFGAITLENIGMPDTQGETMAQRARREVAARCDMCTGWREKEGKKITACMEACPAMAISMVEPDGTIIHAPEPPKKEKTERPTEQAAKVSETVKAAEATKTPEATEEPAKAPETAETSNEKINTEKPVKSTEKVTTKKNK